VAVAHTGEEVDVAAGSYPGEVVVTKRLTIKGFHSPIVDARDRGRGILIRGPSAAGSVVQDVVVENAAYEGILALGTMRVTIAHNVVRHNDRGLLEPGQVAENASFVQNFTGECRKNGQPPGIGLVDEREGGCGEAIHLASTSDSHVFGNVVTDNSGGIYLTDESGPAAHNLIADNSVVGNVYDCAITLASHSRRAVTSNRRLQPRAGGVYDNTIEGNVADRNGVVVPGSGILVAAQFSGGAAYDNRIIRNTVNGNGMPGIALHSHKRLQDLNGNIIQDNVVGRNAVGGEITGPGDRDSGIHHTAGILVWSAKAKITALQVSGNRISQDYFGIWTQNAPHLQRAANHYTHVRVPLSQH
jgi:parallel beta-helix repeat protein